mmetsp:Transcript_23720/g.16792  ORF Transcript_23720/g.16792 Transcript_23720/m.16792 type:complete len:93 (+) Transcript_23720:296-574(+)
MKAIKSVGGILEPYAYHKKLFGFGFGAIPKFSDDDNEDDKVSHCFNLTGTKYPTIEGIENLMKRYKETLKRTILWGPTFFSRVLKNQLEYMD